MAEPGRVELMLLGQTLTVRSEADPDYLRALAAYLEERVAALRKGGVRDPMTALSLAALDITDELFRAREDRARDDGTVGARIGALLQLLDEMAPRESRADTAPRPPA
ncbi:MAG TPA: cell division protein ZapA [Methylomirabilota bacterium]|nr:cell division protein ZapA [Methylomirabilota bacterium]